jgi:hypothetical protein
MKPDDAQTLLDRIDALRHPCDLDLLIFFVKHPHTLMGSEQLATFMGYGIKQVAHSLDVLLEAGLLTRSQARSQVARMYVLAADGVHRAWLPALAALASTRDGRLSLIRVLNTRTNTRNPRSFLLRPAPDVVPAAHQRTRRRGTE